MQDPKYSINTPLKERIKTMSDEELWDFAKEQAKRDEKESRLMGIPVNVKRLIENKFQVLKNAQNH